MQDEMLSRRSFLAGGAAVLGLAAIPFLAGPATAVAAGAGDVSASPFPYEQLDPDVIGRRAYEIYYTSYCAEANWWPIIEALAASSNPTTAAAWQTIPKNIFKYASGGVDGWGTICGCLNGACAIIAATGAPAGVGDALVQWYTETALPSNFIDKSVRDGWTPTGAPVPLVNVPTSIAESPLCHNSLSQWTMVSKGLPSTVASVGDRCGKLSGDVCRKAVQLLNAYHKDSAHIVPTTVLSESTRACKAPGCHTGAFAQGKQNCDPCHTMAADHMSK